MGRISMSGLQLANLVTAIEFGRPALAVRALDASRYFSSGEVVLKREIDCGRNRGSKQATPSDLRIYVYEKVQVTSIYT